MTAVVTTTELHRRFYPADPTMRRACSLMRQMRHVTRKGETWTTEAWLAEWLAAEALPEMNWPPKDPVYDPLEECVAQRVLALVRKLAEDGLIQVTALKKEAA